MNSKSRDFSDDVKKAIDHINLICKDGNPFLLVSGELSGIQNAVYTISPKGALKSLRARSFMLELLCEHICYEFITNILGNYNQFKNHVVFCGGGNFFLLLPNNPNSLNVLNDLNKNINDWAFEEFSGKLYVAFTHLAVVEEELIEGNFNTVWDKLSKQLEIEKSRKFNYKLADIFKKDNIKEPIEWNNQQECQICHRDDVEFNRLIAVNPDDQTTVSNITDGDQLDNLTKSGFLIYHDLCYHLLRIGSILKNVDFICRVKEVTCTKSDKKEASFDLLKLPSFKGYAFYSVTNTDVKPIHTWEINPAPERDLFSEGISPFYFAKYDGPSNEPMDTDKLANASTGAKMIACLRMDVDDLGRIITDNKELDLVLLAEFSDRLNYFFKYRINDICEGILTSGAQTKIPVNSVSEKRNVTIVYAGGDDLFIVGAWNETTELCLDIQKDFANTFPGLGISAGLTLHKPGYPLYQMAKQSKAAIEFAKNDDSHNTGHQKNRVTLFYSNKRTIKRKNLNQTGRLSSFEDRDIIRLAYLWEDYDDFIKPFLQVFATTERIKNNKLVLAGFNPNFIHKMFLIVQKWETSNEIYLPSLMNLLYDIKGNITDADLQQMINLFPALNSKNIKTLNAALTWLSYLMR